MSPRLRKFAFATHLTVSVGWIGAVVAFLVLVVGAWTSQDERVLRGAWIAMEAIGWYAIVPLAIASLATGLVMALGTTWGLLRHYWVLISLVLTVLATLVLLSNMQTVTYFAGLAAGLEGDNTRALRAGLRGELLHAGLGLAVLLVIQVLNVYKPRGMTCYGQHRARQRTSRDRRRAVPGAPQALPHVEVN